jgi:hypothetical protein
MKKRVSQGKTHFDNILNIKDVLCIQVNGGKCTEIENLGLLSQIPM